MKELIKLILKFAFAGAIIYWLVQRGQIDFTMIPKSLEYKHLWAATFAILLPIVFMTSYRWRMLLRVKSQVHLPFLSILRLTWVGMFFSAVLPGAVTGDLVKLVYARSLDHNLSKSFLLTSILMDRVIGLLGLLSLLGISTIIHYSELIAVSPKMETLVHFNFLIFFGVLTALACIFIPARIQNRVLQLAGLLPFVGERIVKLLESVWIFGKHYKTIALSLLISFVVQFCNLLAFWTIIQPFLPIALPFRFAFSFIPLGLVAIAIPITPAGLGVGHAFFANLFAFFHVNNGASLFNFYFLASLTMNLLGIFPYLFGGKLVSLKETKEMEEENS